MTCPMCCDVGWVLDTNPGSNRSASSYCRVSCPTASGPRAIATLSVDGRFRDVVRHPKDGRVMSLTGFIGLASR
jgi:hypothetical protein